MLIYRRNRRKDKGGGEQRLAGKELAMERRSSENLSTDLSEDLIESGVLEASEGSGREGRVVSASVSSSSRTSFTSLSQVDADLALARALQQQVCLFLAISFCFQLSWQRLLRSCPDL